MNPKTKEEAEAYRYGGWSGNPRGHAYAPARCAKEVWHGMRARQCSKRNGKGPDGLYCGTHAKRFQGEK